MKIHPLIMLGAVCLMTCCTRTGDPSYDAQALEMLAQPGAREARQWLAANKDNNIGEYDPAASRSHVESLYVKGALRVTAVQIQPDSPGNEWCDFLVVELPEKRQWRQAMFAVETGLARTSGEFEPEGDRGQQYLVLWYEASGSTPP
jgi:hypothetical protein